MGYDPTALAEQVRRYVGIAEKNLGYLDTLEPKIGTAIREIVDATPNLALERAESLSIIYDRLVKAGLNLVKATDELSRLQSFLSGGPDTRPDLSSLGEIELRGIIVTAIRALGVTEVQKLIGEAR